VVASLDGLLGPAEQAGDELPREACARPVLAVMLVAVALAGCGGSTSGGGSTETVVGTEESSDTSGSEPEISAACTAAMAAYSEALVSDPDISEGPFQRRTIHACKSRDEWLKAVEPYTEGAEARLRQAGASVVGLLRRQGVGGPSLPRLAALG
jgi:hypothetical protein